jgi:hypothetical protein
MDLKSAVQRVIVVLALVSCALPCLRCQSSAELWVGRWCYIENQTGHYTSITLNLTEDSFEMHTTRGSVAKGDGESDGTRGTMRVTGSNMLWTTKYSINDVGDWYAFSAPDQEIAWKLSGSDLILEFKSGTNYSKSISFSPDTSSAPAPAAISRAPSGNPRAECRARSAEGGPSRRTRRRRPTPRTGTSS